MQKIEGALKVLHDFDAVDHIEAVIRKGNFGIGADGMAGAACVPELCGGDFAGMQMCGGDLLVGIEPITQALAHVSTPCAEIKDLAGAWVQPGRYQAENNFVSACMRSRGDARGHKGF